MRKRGLKRSAHFAMAQRRRSGWFGPTTESQKRERSQQRGRGRGSVALLRRDWIQTDRRHAAGWTPGQRNLAVMEFGNPIGSAESKSKTPARFTAAEVRVKRVRTSMIRKSGAAVGNVDADLVLVMIQ